MKKFFLFTLTIFFLCSLTNAEAAKFKFSAPILTAEFDKMDFPPLYPTYSWEPLPKTEFYQVQVVEDGKIVRDLKNDEGFDRVTEWQAENIFGRFELSTKTKNRSATGLRKNFLKSPRR